jgi:hypothetical protein
MKYVKHNRGESAVGRIKVVQAYASKIELDGQKSGSWQARRSTNFFWEVSLQISSPL